MYDMILQGARSLGVEGMERLVADLKAAILSALAGGSPGGPAGRVPEARARRRRLPALAVPRLREVVLGVDRARARALQAPRRHLGLLHRGDGRRREPGAPAVRGRPGAEQIRAGLAPACVAGSEVSTDMHSSYAAPLSEAGAASHNRYGAADAGEDELGMVNALHERLRGFLWRFRGVSTRRLQRYLWWFCWEEQVRRSDASREAMLRSHVANGSYESTRRDLEEEPQPFWDFWESRDESDVSNLV